MREIAAPDMPRDAQGLVAWHISRQEFDLALQVFIERREEIPEYRRRFYLICVQDGLSGHNSYRRVIKTALIVFIINLLFQPLFSLQLLDAFALLWPGRFLYYNYYASLVPHALNLFFVFGLLLQWHTWVALPARLFGRQRRRPAYRIGRAGCFALILLLFAYSAFRLIPFGLDLPMALNGDYLTRSISEDEMTVMVYCGIISSTPDRPDITATLIRELWDDYGVKYPDDAPAPYHKREWRLFGETDFFYLDAEGEYYEMSELRLRASPYNLASFPLVIKYLRHSKIILRIANEAA